MGLKRPVLRTKVRLYDKYLQQMDQELQKSKWLVGDEFGLADVSLTPYVNRVAMMGMSGWWEDRLPHLAEWWARIQEVPTFQSPQSWIGVRKGLTNDLLTFGSQSWPDVKRIIGIK